METDPGRFSIVLGTYALNADLLFGGKRAAMCAIDVDSTNADERQSTEKAKVLQSLA